MKEAESAGESARLSSEAAWVWVGQVQGLTDPVIRRHSQGPAIRIPEGDVVEPSRAIGRRWAASRLPSVQPDVVVVPTRTEEGCGFAHPLHHRKAEDLRVESDGALKIRDLEVHVAHHGSGWQRLYLTIVAHEVSRRPEGAG